MRYRLTVPARINLLGNPGDANEGDFATMVASRSRDIVRVPIEDAVRQLKTVPAALLDDAEGFFG